MTSTKRRKKHSKQRLIQICCSKTLNSKCLNRDRLHPVILPQQPCSMLIDQIHLHEAPLYRSNPNNTSHRSNTLHLDYILTLAIHSSMPRQWFAPTLSHPSTPHPSPQLCSVPPVPSARQNAFAVRYVTSPLMTCTPLVLAP
jgi:hypothetical protein